MHTILNYLEQLDLSEVEAKLYLQLLKTGAITVSDLARTMGINRSTTYLYVNQLIEKELIIKLVKGSSTQIAAIHPKKMLPYLVEKRAATAKILQEKLPAILQNIDVSFPKVEDTGEAEVKFYKGKFGVKKIYEDALKAKELRTYFNIEIIKEALPDNEMLFFEALKNNKAIKIFELFQDTTVVRSKLENFPVVSIKHERYCYKFLPKGITLSASDVLIYDGTVAIINVRNQISGIVLQNSDYYNNSKELFDLIWKVLP